jgi:hypothetical protein
VNWRRLLRHFAFVVGMLFLAGVIAMHFGLGFLTDPQRYRTNTTGAKDKWP